MAELPASLPLQLGGAITPGRCARMSRDPEEDYRDTTNFSWGAGPVAPGKEHAPPSQGGVYRAKCPPVEIVPSGNLSVRVRETPWRRGDPPRGYPGRQVG